VLRESRTHSQGNVKHFRRYTTVLLDDAPLTKRRFLSIARVDRRLSSICQRIVIVSRDDA
jgi:hypothetical protein